MTHNGVSLADNLLENMLERIGSGQWRPGTVIPSQRELTAEFGVSGVPLREALSMMKAMGLLDVQQGRKTMIKRMDLQVVQRLLPLAFSLEGQQDYEQVYDLRLTLEPRAAYLAAQRRAPEKLDTMKEQVEQLRLHSVENGDAEFFRADVAFHTLVAQASGNTFFALLQTLVAGFVVQAQTLGCSHAPERRMRAVISHESILDAIAAQDANRAAVEMEAHLRYSASHYLHA